jgi:hypothetical protein
MKARRFLLGLLLAASLAHADDDVRKTITETALRYVGVPYVYGSSSPNGFDCSGFVGFVYRASGISLPRSSRAIWASGESVDMAAARPGDIVVFNTVGDSASHVAILLDKGSVIHAVSSGPKTGVIVSPLNDRYFGRRIMGARSYISAGPGIPPAVPEAVPEQNAPVQTGTPVIEPVGFTITNRTETYTDTIPAALGSGIQFAVTNGTGRDGIFEILFYKMDLNPAKVQTLRRDRLEIRNNQTVEIEPVFFAETGRYKLILKTGANIQRMERIWQVVSL